MIFLFEDWVIMRKIDITNFINRANIEHNFKYDYSMSEYISSKIKVKIICPKHGVFEQTPDSHLHGHGCNSCSVETNKKKQLKNISDFIINSNHIHNNKYDYSKTIYRGSHIKVKIICPKHGVFEQTPDSHLHGRGCPRCVNRNKTTTIFIDESNLVHQCIYDYSLCEYINPKIKVKIICPKHGVFKQTPNSHLNGCGCPICCSSKGEQQIAKYLNLNKIKFVREKRFNECKNKYKLPFDFYLPENNILIEFDGVQHSKPVNFRGISNELAIENFNNILINDKIKNVFAINNNIKLIRVNYNVEDINIYLKNKLKT